MVFLEKQLAMALVPQSSCQKLITFKRFAPPSSFPRVCANNTKYIYWKNRENGSENTLDSNESKTHTLNANSSSLKSIFLVFCCLVLLLLNNFWPSNRTKENLPRFPSEINRKKNKIDEKTKSETAVFFFSIQFSAELASGIGLAYCRFIFWMEGGSNRWNCITLCLGFCGIVCRLKIVDFDTFRAAALCSSLFPSNKCICALCWLHFLRFSFLFANSGGGSSTAESSSWPLDCRWSCGQRISLFAH